MKCSSPLEIKGIVAEKVAGKGASFPVPCRRCLPCRLNRQSEWAGKILMEWYIARRALFVTLTYEDQFLPEDGLLSKEDAQKFLKRLRWNVGEKSQSIRYFLAGEYGKKTLRPHYHAVIYGLDSSDANEVSKAWGSGFVHSKCFEANAAKYIAKYVCKPADEEAPPQWSLQSKHPALGDWFLPEIAKAQSHAMAKAGITSDMDKATEYVPCIIKIAGRFYKIDTRQRRMIGKLMGIYSLSVIDQSLGRQIAFHLKSNMERHKQMATPGEAQAIAENYYSKQQMRRTL